MDQSYGSVITARALGAEVYWFNPQHHQVKDLGWIGDVKGLSRRAQGAVPSLSGH